MDRIGEGPGEGKNINVPLYFAEEGYGDADYFKIFDELLLPVARSFAPDLVMIACGFDSAEGDPVGLFKITPEGYEGLLRRITHEVPSQKIVLVLEGGYNPEVVAKCTEQCLRVLLGETSGEEGKGEGSSAGEGISMLPQTGRVIKEVKEKLAEHWPSLL
jgi:histone deacetylase 6